MDANIQTTTLKCSQCGGELHPEEGQIFLTCPYCSATVYLDKSQVVFHWYLTPTLNAEQAGQSLARWMAGNETVKDLDKKAQVIGQTFQYFPLWYLKRRVQDKEEVEMQLAAATSVTELGRLPLTAGDLKSYEPSVEPQCVTPTIPLQTIIAHSLETAGPGAQVSEAALVHVPIFTFKYVYKNQPFTAVVEAGTGKTLANIYPAKAEAPYITAGIVTALVFACLALIPVAFASAGRGASSTGIFVCLGLGLIAAPLLFIFAAWVASKV
jgi:predicted RNA-binding Zn-ribbon protein involved in translation (DUF1610 family)